MTGSRNKSETADLRQIKFFGVKIQMHTFATLPAKLRYLGHRSFLGHRNPKGLRCPLGFGEGCPMGIWLATPPTSRILIKRLINKNFSELAF